jgi:cytochrome c oxidase subunit II
MLFSSVANAQSFMPPEGTELAGQIDSLYAFLLWVSAISSVLVIGGLTYFAIKYKRNSENDKTPNITHNTFLEFVWSFVPFVIFMIVFGWGWYLFHQLRTAPANAFEVRVDGQKWYWNFVYKSGKTSTGTLVVPAGEPIKLVMTSRDVLHSFFVPAFRIKQDVVPGMYSTLWFNAPKPGNYQVFCTEYCGDQHSAMLAKVQVLPRADFDKWLQDNPYKGLTLAQVGQVAFGAKCTVCHHPTAEKKVGPGMLALFGKNREFTDGTSLVADENYIRESILNPMAKVVKDYPGAMPTFLGQLSEDELNGIIEYLKTLK